MELSSAGLFAGIGGIERGFELAGIESSFLCEVDPHASAVLEDQFPGVELVGDVCEIDALPNVDILAAGFPCQDLSQAGRTGGITGSRSGLVSEVFRLLESADPRWLVLENVPFMLQLDRGQAMSLLATTFTELGYEWAYRVVDSRSFGLPQRRRRVIFVASRVEDPRRVLFADHSDEVAPDHEDPRAFGFYWTEGLRGVGWGVEAIPTLKNGSTIGIPSPPAIWIPETREIGTPAIEDAERFQGFPVDWTRPASLIDDRGDRHRWRLVGNAVSVPVAHWLGRRLVTPGDVILPDEVVPVPENRSWPSAAFSIDGVAMTAPVSEFPLEPHGVRMSEFLERPLKPLSARAAAGFLSRARRGSLRFEPGFLEAMQAHVDDRLGDRLLV